MAPYPSQERKMRGTNVNPTPPETVVQGYTLRMTPLMFVMDYPYTGEDHLIHSSVSSGNPL